MLSWLLFAKWFFQFTLHGFATESKLTRSLCLVSVKKIVCIVVIMCYSVTQVPMLSA